MVQPEPLVYREEVTAILFTLADINVNLAKVLRLLEEEFGGEGLEEDDS